MKNLTLIHLFLVAAMIVLSSCSGSKSATQTPLEITSLDWRLVSIQSANNKELKPKDFLPTLSIKNGEATGTTGCNSFNGQVTVKGNSLTFGKMVMTRKFCPNVSEVENAITQALDNTDNYSIENGDLLLKKGKTVLAVYSSFR